MDPRLTNGHGNTQAGSKPKSKLTRAAVEGAIERLKGQGFEDHRINQRTIAAQLGCLPKDLHAFVQNPHLKITAGKLLYAAESIRARGDELTRDELAREIGVATTSVKRWVHDVGRLEGVTFESLGVELNRKRPLRSDERRQFQSFVDSLTTDRQRIVAGAAVLEMFSRRKLRIAGAVSLAFGIIQGVSSRRDLDLLVGDVLDVNYKSLAQQLLPLPEVELNREGFLSRLDKTLRRRFEIEAEHDREHLVSRLFHDLSGGWRLYALKKFFSFVLSESAIPLSVAQDCIMTLIERTRAQQRAQFGLSAVERYVILSFIEAKYRGTYPGWDEFCSGLKPPNKRGRLGKLGAAAVLNGTQWNVGVLEKLRCAAAGREGYEKNIETDIRQLRSGYLSFESYSRLCRLISFCPERGASKGLSTTELRLACAILQRKGRGKRTRLTDLAAESGLTKAHIQRVLGSKKRISLIRKANQILSVGMSKTQHEYVDQFARVGFWHRPVTREVPTLLHFLGPGDPLSGRIRDAILEVAATLDAERVKIRSEKDGKLYPIGDDNWWELVQTYFSGHHRSIGQVLRYTPLNVNGVYQISAEPPENLAKAFRGEHTLRKESQGAFRRFLELVDENSALRSRLNGAETGPRTPQEEFVAELIPLPVAAQLKALREYCESHREGRREDPPDRIGA